MKLPFSMITDLVETSLTPTEVGDLLTMAGFELEGLEKVGSEDVLDLKVVANRGDGLSAIGVAREILAKDDSARSTALYQRAIGRFESDSTPRGGEGSLTIQTDHCTRYGFRILRDAENGASPGWLQERLSAAGMRSISLLVDLTNYVMLELGQPLHAFDLDRLGGPNIVVREARDGEKIRTLNDEEKSLANGMVVICTPDRPVAVAGVMGGLETEVHAGTKNVLLESAHFVNTSVRKTRKALGLNTESSYRFERSVDACGVCAAINRFVELYQECSGGKGSWSAEIREEVRVVSPVVSLSVRMDRAERLLGLKVGAENAARYLTNLGFAITQNDGNKITVEVPSWRNDIEIENDLIEEIGRVHGFEKIPETPMSGVATRGGVFGVPKLADQAREALLKCGLTQIISHSLRDAHPLDFRKDRRVGPRNPHSPETSLLRDSLLPGLAETAQRNGGKNLHLFEIGRVFVKGEWQIDESPEIAILSTGNLNATHWAEKTSPEADFYSLKGVVEELAGALGDAITFDYPRDPDERFHPTRQAGVLLDSGKLWAGTVGQIHPDIAGELGLPLGTIMAELDLLVFELQDNVELPVRSISRNPAIRRDLAFVIDKEVAFSTIESKIAETCGEDLEKQWLFDVYEGAGIEAGKHSLAIALQLRRMNTNLTDEDANEIRDRAVAAVSSLGGQLR